MVAVAERKPVIRQGKGVIDFDGRSRIVMATEKELVKKSVGLDLTALIVTHLNLGLTAELSHNPHDLFINLPSYSKFKAFNKFMTPQEEVKIFTQFFASNLARNWNANPKDGKLSEKERKIASNCFDLREKGYSLKKVIEEICHQFNLSQKDAMEIVKKEYFTIDDLANDMNLNRGSLKNRVSQVLKRNPGIMKENFGGLTVKRTFIPRIHWDKVKSAIELSVQQAEIKLPDNKEIIVNGRVKKKILKILAEKAKSGERGISLDEILDFYPKDDRKRSREEAHHVISDLRKSLESFGWTIQNYYINKGPRAKHISAYFLKKVENPTFSPVIVFQED